MLSPEARALLVKAREQVAKPRGWVRSAWVKARTDQAEYWGGPNCEFQACLVGAIQLAHNKEAMVENLRQQKRYEEEEQEMYKIPVRKQTHTDGEYYTKDPAYQEALDHLAAANGLKPAREYYTSTDVLVDWNDNEKRRKAQVVRALDKALEAA